MMNPETESRKIENGIVSYYISEDFDIEDGEETVYYFANGNRIAKNSTDGTFWYLDDHLGSTNVMIDSDGELVERTLYYPFGSHREGGEERYSFTGKEFDSEIGLYYYGARYYNPETFVFTQADTLIPDYYNPQSLNRYSYCYNNPLKYEDPDGHNPLFATAAIGAAVGAVLGGGMVAYKQIQATGGISVSLSGGIQVHGKVTDWSAVGKGAVVGAVGGGVAGLTMGYGIGLASGTLTVAGATSEAALVGTATTGLTMFGTGAADVTAAAITYGAVGTVSATFGTIAGDAVDIGVFGADPGTFCEDLPANVIAGGAGGFLAGGSATAKSSVLLQEVASQAPGTVYQFYKIESGNADKQNNNADSNSRRSNDVIKAKRSR
ncbi:hypothetical protein MmiHf6_13930 [Methanimicrococcus hongohii]|uniref:RHS repeat-associated core domain-containing protein n=1 Tax=Methanimicrococcus hongohii TaxID=3028295 RepID=A0AA97A2H3_9EURY|nr:RHS repeat-associated core domain-containing protein [Methanimicrococcus sp. Hf6]WNY24068.1 hypothetical protein MmiHf6_13930 [Methanimicrococcus sp. Hf6]